MRTLHSASGEDDEDSTEKVPRKQQEACMVLNQQKDKEHPFENVAESRNDAGVIPHKQHSKTPKVDQNKSFGSIELTPGFHPCKSCSFLCLYLCLFFIWLFETCECIFETSECIFETSKCIFETSECIFETSECIFETSECTSFSA